MANNKVTSKLVDEIILFAAVSSSLAAGVVAPNIFIALDKPLRRLYKHLDENERKRQLQNTLAYMRRQRLLAENFEYGLQLTKKSRKRLLKIELEATHIPPQTIWDKQWRIVLYDIPEEHRTARIGLTAHLRQAGFYQFQQSAWITPFPCVEQVATLAAHYKVDRYISYFDALNLANEQLMIARFQKKYPTVKF
jgi:DNA-binding transcriptional regulator PaaX